MYYHHYFSGSFQNIFSLHFPKKPRKMVALKYMLGKEIESDLFKCWFCDKQYNVKNGVAALRRHHEAKHTLELQQILHQLKANTTGLESSGAPHPQELLMANIKVEEDLEMSFPNSYHPPPPNDTVPSENQHPPHHHINHHHSMDDGNIKPPGWSPSLKGRSIVWDHITWVPETQRASCNYCPAEFQIKGGTSALLRHLKTIHPAAINFDPENPPPVVRRKKRKADDYTMMTGDTKDYMETILQMHMPDEAMLRGIDGGGSVEPSTSPPLALQDPMQHLSEVVLPGGGAIPPPITGTSTTMTTIGPNRAETEIEEQLRNLQKESATQQSAAPHHQDLRTLLGMTDEPELVSVSGGGAPPPIDNHNNTSSPTPPPSQHRPPVHDEEKQVSSSSGSGGKKRKVDETTMVMPRQMGSYPGLNCGKLPLSLLQPHRRPPPPIHHPGSAVPPSTVLPPGIPLLNHQIQMPMTPSSSTTSSMMPPGFSGKYSTQGMQALDFDSRVLYHQTMRAEIARENAMAAYYNMKARKMELEIKKLERELGVEEQPMEPVEQQDPEQEE